MRGKTSNAFTLRSCREKAEPRKGFQPIPMTLLVCLFALLMWGGWYLGEYDADFAPNRLDGPAAFVTRQAATNAEPVKLDPLAVGKRLFNNCVTCHQSHGNGTGTYPPLNKSEWVNGRPEVFAALLLHGINGPFEVEGRTYDAEMPPWGAKLTNFEIAAVMSYVRSNWDNNSEAVDETVVEEVRKSVKRREPWTMDELIKFRDTLPPPIKDGQADAQSGQTEIKKEAEQK